jgi:hypothetical protein
MAVSIQASEIGKMVIFQNALSGGPSFTGSTCTALITNPIQQTNTYSLQISSDGTYAFFITSGNEFPVPGLYKLQLKYQGQGDTFFGEVNTITIKPNL